MLRFTKNIDARLKRLAGRGEDDIEAVASCIHLAASDSCDLGSHHAPVLGEERRSGGVPVSLDEGRVVAQVREQNGQRARNRHMRPPFAWARSLTFGPVTCLVPRPQRPWVEARCTSLRSTAYSRPKAAANGF